MGKVTDKIIKREWAMFDKVNSGADIRADCQDDFPTFRIMRASQLDAWDDATRAAYLRDLTQAEREGRNLVMEKYAYMMEYTAPEEFEAMRESLPEITEEKRALVREIAARQVAWQEEVGKEYPRLVSRGRPIRQSGDGPFGVSVETYTLGELASYSMETLKAYSEFMDTLARQGENLAKMILENTARMYGHPSLEAAEEWAGRAKA
ncbi:MAG TPA: DUF4125 domain-containing protein [Clostridiales bacterium]|nr:DUF4125 domain-containing protein [Clostridiales bacterium]